MSKSFSLIWSLEGQTRKKKSFGKLISYYFSAWYLFCFQVELLCGCSASSFFPLQSESLQMKIRYLDAFSSILNTTLNFPSDWTRKWMKLQRKKKSNKILCQKYSTLIVSHENWWLILKMIDFISSVNLLVTQWGKMHIESDLLLFEYLLI